MHENSLTAYRSETKRITLRAATVFAWICRHGRATDREVMRGLGFTDPNKVRPRITELVDVGMLVEVENKRDTETGKTVRVVDIAPRYGNQRELFVPGQVVYKGVPIEFDAP